MEFCGGERSQGEEEKRYKDTEREKRRESQRQGEEGRERELYK